VNSLDKFTKVENSIFESLKKTLLEKKWFELEVVVKEEMKVLVKKYQ
jgi:hypothetical protein